MPNFKKIEANQIKLGQRFTAPVFFDDGKNMFLAKRCAVKKYHLDAINYWKFPFFLTVGDVLPGIDQKLEKSFAGFAKYPTLKTDDSEELEELDEVEEVEDLEELEELD